MKNIRSLFSMLMIAIIASFASTTVVADVVQVNTFEISQMSIELIQPTQAVDLQTEMFVFQNFQDLEFQSPSIPIYRSDFETNFETDRRISTSLLYIKENQLIQSYNRQYEFQLNRKFLLPENRYSFKQYPSKIFNTKYIV